MPAQVSNVISMPEGDSRWSTALNQKRVSRAASTANVGGTYNSTGGSSSRGQFTAMPDNLDGVSLAQGNRVLLKNQTNKDENGIWVVTTLGTGADGVWDRATDFDSDSEVVGGVLIEVSEGTTNGDTSWRLTTDDPITIGGASGTDLDFAQASGSVPATVAGAGITDNAGTYDIVAADDSLTVNANDMQVNLDGVDDTIEAGGSGLRVKAGSLTDAKFDAAAGIATSKLADGGEFVQRDGSVALTGNLDFNSNKGVNLAAPTADNDAGRLVDINNTRLAFKDPVRVATTGALPSNTRSTNRLTADSNGVLPAVDGKTLLVNDRLLVKDEVLGQNNGLFKVTDLGSGSTPWILDRTSDGDSTADMPSGLQVRVEEGSSNGQVTFYLTTPNPIVLNTTALTFGSDTSVGAGNGLTKSGGSYHVNVGDGLVISSDQVKAKLDGTTLANGPSGLKINTGGVGDAQVSVISTRSKLPSAIAYEDEVNVFTGLNSFKDVELDDQDGTPVADRRLRCVDGMVVVTDTGQVEGRYIKKESLEKITDAEVDDTGITTRTKLPSELVYEDEANTFTDANTFQGLTDFDGDVQLKDQDGTPVADRRLRCIDGKVVATDTSQVEGQHISAASVEQGAGSGLDADTLDGQQGSYYTDASNLNAGTVPNARLAKWDVFKSWGPEEIDLPTTNAGSISSVGTGDDAIRTFKLTDGVTEGGEVTFIAPSAAVDVKVRWISSSTTGEARLGYTAKGGGDYSAAYAAYTYQDETANGSANNEVVTTFSLTGLIPGNLVRFRFQREGAHANDDIGADVHVLGLTQEAA